MERPGATTLKGNPFTSDRTGTESRRRRAGFQRRSIRRCKPVTLKDTGDERPHFQRCSLARYARLRRADQAVQRGGGQACRTWTSTPSAWTCPLRNRAGAALSAWTDVKMLSDHRSGSFGRALRHADQGTAHREPRHLRGGPEPPLACGVCEGSRRSPQLRSRSFSGARGGRREGVTPRFDGARVTVIRYPRAAPSCPSTSPGPPASPPGPLQSFCGGPIGILRRRPVQTPLAPLSRPEPSPPMSPRGLSVNAILDSGRIRG